MSPVLMFNEEAQKRIYSVSVTENSIYSKKNNPGPVINRFRKGDGKRGIPSEMITLELTGKVINEGRTTAYLYTPFNALGAKSSKKGFKIIEVPVIFTDRTRGTSKMSGSIISEAVFGVIKMT